MIAVSRTGVPEPAVLTKCDKNGTTERDRAVAHYNAESAETFTFERYKHDDVKNTLHQLFCGKCAYCEAPYEGTQPPDVEHYRPKAGLDPFDAPDHPGYYWLASEWTNLLPSCIDCNRRRWQDLPDGTRIPAGKGARFPLAPGSIRASVPGDETLERRVLLDPTRDDPERFIGFQQDGIVYARSIDGVRSEEGYQSIVVYGLYRIGVTRLRQRHARFISMKIRDAERATKTLSRYSSDPDARETLDESIEYLRQAISAGEPFAALARSLVASSPFRDLLETIRTAPMQIA